MGLGIDAGLVYVNKGKMQDIADATALAGAAHIGEDGNGVTAAVDAFINANGLEVTENELVSVTEDGWTSLAALGDNESLRVAYGIVTVNDKPRLRVRIDKRVPLPFTATFLPSFSKGLTVAAVAAAEGNAADEPVFRIIGRNGVYDHFFNLSGASATGDPDKWIKGSVYAGNMLRASYKQNNPQEARNMVSVDGYIFADMMNTGLPLMNGVTGTSSSPSDDRIFRSDYVRRKNGEEVLSGFDALLPSNYKAPNWSDSAKNLAEDKLDEYSSTLSALVNDEEIKRKARNKEDNYRYICNKAVKDNLEANSVKDLQFDRLANGVPDTAWENKTPKNTNHQYSNIDVGQTEIDVLYVEIQGDSITNDLKDGREGAVWLGCNTRIKNLKKINKLIVELKTTPTAAQATNGITSGQLSGSFIIAKEGNGCEFGAIYSQANLVIRAPSSTNSPHSFKGPVFSEKYVSFSYDNKCGGGGRNKPHFGRDAVIAGNVVLFGYGYEIGPSVFDNNNHIGTHHYDDLTNYKTENNSGGGQGNWWDSGIKTVDYLNSSNQVFVMSGFDFHDEQYVKDNPGAQNEIELLQKLWAAIDDRDQDYNEQHNNTINLKGSLYGDYGRWPTEFSTSVGSDSNSTLLMCTFDGPENAGSSTTTTLKLVE